MILTLLFGKERGDYNWPLSLTMIQIRFREGVMQVLKLLLRDSCFSQLWIHLYSEWLPRLKCCCQLLEEECNLMLRNRSVAFSLPAGSVR